ncbi:electron transfer flavoprotein subunit beta/FixA family protein [Neoactinobaculum massilliense]|uniref:electron transfer flavoprotein subunit beta/FixA family protein n=1 Tax=Neoactinobaculum massilliense TaxID=2364794 RepID=UPI000F52BBFD|nr:electron transfer flavoprotein beta subunit/FixA family protein [Neoactinobaculum massilliense]
MSIVVAYKWAANPQDANVRGDGTVDWGRAKASVSDYDAVAIEVGRQLATELGTELVGVCVGGKGAASPMAKKSALSRGLDRVIVVSDESLEHAESTETGLVLAEAIRGIPDVTAVITGDSSVDLGAQIVPAVAAGALGWLALSSVEKVSASGSTLQVERVVPEGTQVVTVTGPAILSVTSEALTPKIPSMKDILSAGKKPSEQVELSTLSPAPVAEVKVVATAKPALKARKGEVIDGSDPEAAAAQLVSALRGDSVL